MATSFVLPATTYQPPARLARRQRLNTIIEDANDGMSETSQQRGRPRAVLPPADSRESSSSSISSYYQSSTRTREFDDLYDVSDESDGELKRAFRPAAAEPRGADADGGRNRYLSLVIPSPSHWPTIHNFPKPKSSPVPPTPSSTIPISPEALKMLGPDLAASSAPPSLDGSLTSDQVAAYSAPPTPGLQYNPADMTPWGNRFEIVDAHSGYGDGADYDADDADAHPLEIQLDEHVRWDQQAHSFTAQPTGPEPQGANAGVQLPAGALDILRHLSLDADVEPESALEGSDYGEMQEVPLKRAHRASADLCPPSATSEYSISAMSIPSPGGFFSSLDRTSRNTWRVNRPDAELPPSSTTAEQFYNAPWIERPGNTVESFVDIPDHDTDGPPTAIRIPFTPLPIPETEPEPLADGPELDVEKEIWHDREETMDRTSMWLAAQTTYMAALRETNPTNDPKDAPGLLTRRIDKHLRSPSRDSLDSPMKKAVRFLDIKIERVEAGKETPSAKADPVFYQAFQRVANATSPNDPFIHRHARYDALQACRASLAHSHVDQLLGKYHTTDAERPGPQRPISTMTGAVGPDETAEQRVIARVERERQALEQVNPAMWVVEATRYLCGGNLLNSPATAALAQAPPLETSGLPSHVRVLDLGGQAQCDWAWHIAREFPNVKTYTVTCDDRAAAGTHLRGPSNHRHVPVTHLWELPFADNHFDAVSARSLFTYLQLIKPLGASADQYDLCLQECLRVLKPGGFLEFFLLDAEIVHAGPLGTAAAVEFGFKLKARGYDAAPTKSWLARVRKAGLTDIKRAWMFLPMGAAQASTYVPPETPPPHISMYEDKLAATEAVQGPVGSNADAAHISGLVGSWLWEQWLLKLEMEMGRGRLLEGVGKVMEEGKATGAGWRCLSGWARKPL
jgi:SAM-dependent methyltransferase